MYTKILLVLHRTRYTCSHFSKCSSIDHLKTRYHLHLLFWIIMAWIPSVFEKYCLFQNEKSASRCIFIVSGRVLKHMLKLHLPFTTSHKLFRAPLRFFWSILESSAVHLKGRKIFWKSHLYLQSFQWMLCTLHFLA